MAPNKRKRSDCGICTEVLSLHSCSVCDFSSCRGCLQTWCLERADRDPSCPGCKVMWREEEKKEMLTLKFVSTRLREKRKEILLAQEYGRMEATVPFAMKKEAERKRAEVEKTLYSVLARASREGETEEIARMRSEARLALQRIYMVLHTLDLQTRGIRSRKCGVPTCSGWVDFNTSHCLSCGERTCSQCGCLSTEGHVCDPSVVESIRAIERDCKPCPSCGASSYRTEGCPTMWCANCHSFWNWDSSRVIRSSGTSPHNPDHRAWLRGSTSSSAPPREAGDIPCGGIIDKTRLISLLQSGIDRASREGNLRSPTIQIARLLIDVRNAVCACHTTLRPLYPLSHNAAWNADLCLDLRVSFILSKISKDKFESSVEARVKKEAANTEMGRILEAFTFCGVDVFLRLEEESQDYNKWGDFLSELMVLKQISMVAMQDVSKKFGRKTPRLTDAWRWDVPRRGIL